ncbi:MAG: D-alanyl-D-alanine carboxypeptidase, partial [Chitinophagaceae bacterium]|nr:D-alanyl-D-alanine carboxypeptidase [Chitinophagaceae bacterium]
MKRLFVLAALLIPLYNIAQVGKTIDSAIQRMIIDSQFRHAIISMCVVDGKSGKIIFSRNAQAGLAPASCQKVITSVAAFELLGKDFTYKTQLAYNGKIKNEVLNGNIEITGSGDPTLGSWRFIGTGEEVVLAQFKKAIAAAGIKQVTGNVIGNTASW